MIYRGVEEPLSANEQLNELSGYPPRIKLSTTHHEKLTRYSFVACEHSDSSHTLLLVLDYLSARWLNPAYWIISVNPPDSSLNPVRGRLLLSRLPRTGWENSPLCTSLWLLAKDPGSPYLFDHEQIPGYNRAVIPMSVSSLDAFHMVCKDYEANWRASGNSSIFAPSPELLNWLADSGTELVYKAQDSSERPGLVYITPNILPVEAIEDSGLVMHSYFGTKASSVWNQP